VEEEAPKVGSGDDAGEAFGHADANARAAEGVFDALVLFLQPVEQGAQGREVAFDAGLLQRRHVEDVGGRSRGMTITAQRRVRPENVCSLRAPVGRMRRRDEAMRAFSPSRRNHGPWSR
jgi:hypothetical protein